MGVIDAALQGIGAGLQTGVATWGREKDRQLDERRVAQQAEIANQNNMRALIVQELRNAGVLQQIDARGDNALELEGVKGANAQGLEGTRQTGRVDLADKNFGHDMALTSFKEGAATERNTANNTTARRGQDVSATTQRRGQDVSAGTQQRGQNLSFDASTFATDSANRRSLVPRPNTAMPFGGVQLPPASYDKYFEEAPTRTPATDPTAPVSAQPQIQSNPRPGPAVAPVPPPRAPATAPAAAPRPAAPLPPAAIQSPAGADRMAPQAAAPASKYSVGQTVKLRNGQTVTIKKLNPDGTFEY